MRVVLLSSFAEICGIATYTEALVEAMRAAGCDPEVIAPRLRPGVSPRGPQPPRAWSHSRGTVREAWRVYRLLRERSAEVVHLQFNHGLFSARFVAALVALCHRGGIAVVATLHGRGGGDAWRRLKWALVRRALRSASMVVHNESHARELEPRPVTVIAHGIHPPERTALADAKRALGIEPATPVLAHFGFITPDKGIADVLEALPRLQQRHPGLLYLVVGGAADHRRSLDHLRQLRARVRALSLQDHVRLDGVFKDHQQVLRELAAADWVVLNYHTGDRQGASGAARHALASGRPLAVSAAAVFDDLRDATVTLRSPLGEALDELLSSSDRARDAQHRAEAYCRRNSWDQIARQHIALYQAISRVDG